MAILIVDDSRDAVVLTATLLRKADRGEVVVAHDAREALALLRDPAMGPSVDLILMDILMPGMDGVEAVTLFKADPSLRDIPVIMVTSMTDADALERSLAAGAMDFARKPLNRLELRARVASGLRLKRETDARKAAERRAEDLARRLADGSAPQPAPGSP